MKTKLTWIVFLIDRSGSMNAIKKDMIGGFNSFIKTQQKNTGECRIFAYKFDTKYEILFENVDIQCSPELTEENYIPRGGTALYDSMGKLITEFGEKLASLTENERPEKVLFVTITDGQDNARLEAGRHFTSDEVKEMVTHQTNVYKWNFAYIGANQDAWAVGCSMGYIKGSTLNYTADSLDTARAFKDLDVSTSYWRTGSHTTSFCFVTNS